MPFNVVTALTRGCTDRDAHKPAKCSPATGRRRLARTIPLLGLMGVVGGGRMMAGRLMVSGAIPAGRETLHCFPTDRERLTGDGRRWLPVPSSWSARGTQ